MSRPLGSDLWLAIFLGESEPIPAPEHVVALATHHLPLRLLLPRPILQDCVGPRQVWRPWSAFHNRPAVDGGPPAGSVEAGGRGRGCRLRSPL